jgi:hypothetical protein
MSLGVLFFGMWVFRYFSMKPPTESKLIQRFQAHRASYERLRQMLLEDKQLNQVYVDEGVGTANSPLIKTPSEANFPISRYNEYVNLLRQVGSNAAFKNREDEPELVCVGIWGAGWAGYSRHVWICSTPHVPNQIASLDAYYHDPNRPHNVFKRIDADWYLRADW